MSSDVNAARNAKSPVATNLVPPVLPLVLFALVTLTVGLVAMLLAAHSLGLGAGVVTSFSQAAVSAVLNAPEGLSPEMLVCLGHAAATQPPGMRSRGPVTWQSLTQWERFPSAGSACVQSMTSRDS